MNTDHSTTRPATKDADYLKILGIFHFVVAGIAFIVSLFPILHLIFGIALITAAFEDTGGENIAALLGWFFVLLAGVWIVFGITFAVAMALAGRALLAQRSYKFCLVMAGVSCVFMPFGTVLGVLTIITLMREPVKELFATSRGGIRDSPAR